MYYICICIMYYIYIYIYIYYKGDRGMEIDNAGDNTLALVLLDSICIQAPH